MRYLLLSIPLFFLIGSCTPAAENEIVEDNQTRVLVDSTSITPITVSVDTVWKGVIEMKY